MADMQFVLRKVGAKVERWDYPTQTWTHWKNGGDYTAPTMVGRYVLVLKGSKWTLQRISQRGNLQWEVVVPEGVSAYHSMKQGGKVVLPWEETDPYIYVCRMAGIDAEKVIFHEPRLTEVTIGLMSGTSYDGRPYMEAIETDGTQKVTEQGVRISLPSYVLQMEISPPLHTGRPPRKFATSILLWKETLSGAGISPRQLLTVLKGLGLKNQMPSWQVALYEEYKATKAKLKVEKEKGGA